MRDERFYGEGKEKASWGDALVVPLEGDEQSGSRDRAAVNLIYQRRAMERFHTRLKWLLEERQPGSEEEADEYVRQFVGVTEVPLPKRRLSPVERAQEIMYDAWSEPRRKRRLKLARQALRVSQDCADAYVLLGEEAGSLEEAREMFEKGVAAGERSLGSLLDEGAGSFWSLVETRPYMRAHLGLAQVLWELGEREKAVEHYRELLRLNPNDNQGVRYLLLDALLVLGLDDDAGELLERYSDDHSVEWLYGGALLAFRRLGSCRAADKKLRNAFRYNPFVPVYMLGFGDVSEELPQELPAYFASGSPEEALSYVSEARAWFDEDGAALRWLAESFLAHMERTLDRRKRRRQRR